MTWRYLFDSDYAQRRDIEAAREQSAAAPLLVRCSRCSQRIEQRDSLISADGLLCAACFEVVGAG